MICARLRSPMSSPWWRSRGAKFKSTRRGIALLKRAILLVSQSIVKDAGSSVTLTCPRLFHPTSPWRFYSRTAHSAFNAACQSSHYNSAHPHKLRPPVSISLQYRSPPVCRSVHFSGHEFIAVCTCPMEVSERPVGSSGTFLRFSRSMCVWNDGRYGGIATLVTLSPEVPK